MMNLMNYNCLAAIVFGLFGYTLIGSAADALFKIAPQTTIANLDPVADRSRGSLKWSNGAFLFKEATGAAAPIFHTLDREGRLVSSFTLEIPGASHFWSGGFDRAFNGSVVFAGGAYSSDGKGAPLLAWISGNGQTERVVRTGAYYVHILSVAPDGTVWTLGCEMINRKTDAPGLDPNAGVLRHFDSSGKLIGSFFPQSEYVKSHNTLWLQSGHMVAGRDRLVWYSPTWGHPGRYAEVDLASMTLKTYSGSSKARRSC